MLKTPAPCCVLSWSWYLSFLDMNCFFVILHCIVPLVRDRFIDSRPNNLRPHFWLQSAAREWMPLQSHYTHYPAPANWPSRHSLVEKLAGGVVANRGDSEHSHSSLFQLTPVFRCNLGAILTPSSSLSLSASPCIHQVISSWFSSSFLLRLVDWLK